VAGTAATAGVIALVAERRGRRAALGLGYLGAIGAGAVAAVAVSAGSFPLLLVGAFLLGSGNAASNLSRYAAAELSAPAARAQAMGLVIWAGTIGAVVGPVLLHPAESAMEGLGGAGLAGPLLLGSAGCAAAAAVVWMVRWGGRPAPGSPPPERGLPRVSLQVPDVRLALIALTLGQVVMVLIMAMTPIHMRHAGEGLGSVGVVIAAHTLGMFAFSPLSGYLSDRVGRKPVIAAGGAILAVSSVLAAFADGDDRTLLVVSLFLLGLGWNLGFVAGSALVAESAMPAERVRLEGLTDSLVWMAAAAGGLASGFILDLGGFGRLSLTGAALAVGILALVGSRRAAPAPA